LRRATGPEVTKATFGFIRVDRRLAAHHRQGEGFFAKYGMPDVEVKKEASWGTTRDNLELGTAGGGIDGAHI